MDAGYELDSDEIKFIDKRVYVDKSVFGVYRLKLAYRKYPAAKKSLSEQYPEAGVLKKPFNWIYSDNYNIGFAAAGQARAVNLISWNETRFHEWKMVEVVLKHRKPE